MPATKRIGWIRAHFVEALTRPVEAPPAVSLQDRWQRGYDAFRRGEIPPADPDEAEGWYWAENQTSRLP